MTSYIINFINLPHADISLYVLAIMLFIWFLSFLHWILHIFCFLQGSILCLNFLGLKLERIPPLSKADILKQHSTFSSYDILNSNFSSYIFPWYVCCSNLSVLTQSSLDPLSLDDDQSFWPAVWITIWWGGGGSYQWIL